MIIGVGHDICDQRRIAKLAARFGDRFTRRVYTAAEQAELEARQNSVAYLASRFAVKEAVYKALSATDQTGMYWHHAQTLSSSSGVPVLSLSGACEIGLHTLVPAGYRAHIHVSISDEPPYSSAFVLFSLSSELPFGQAEDT
jgi:holo-[acyl-carrier protein] synthase